MLIPDALFTGKNMIYFAEIDSTNSYILNTLSKTNPPEGTCVITDYQTAGRGQIGRYWHSEAGKNLLVSYIFYPKTLNINDQFYLNIISSLSVRDVVSYWLDDVKIKWPNDIYINDKKVAGILVQSVVRGTSIKNVVVGIGLNVNERDFPASLPNPISMISSTGADIDIQAVLRFLSARLEFYFLQLKSNKKDVLFDEYRTHLYRLQMWHSYKDDDGNEFLGFIKGIDKQGKLQIMSENGDIRSFGFREISFVI